MQKFVQRKSEVIHIKNKRKSNVKIKWKFMLFAELLFVGYCWIFILKQNKLPNNFHLDN